jgi:hypothetical protein
VARREQCENAPQCFGFYVFCRPFLRGKTEEFRDKIQKVMLPWGVGMTPRNAFFRNKFDFYKNICYNIYVKIEKGKSL